jgi:hypothetical protein
MTVRPRLTMARLGRSRWQQTRSEWHGLDGNDGADGEMTTRFGMQFAY